MLRRVRCGRQATEKPTLSDSESVTGRSFLHQLNPNSTVKGLLFLLLPAVLKEKENPEFTVEQSFSPQLPLIGSAFLPALDESEVRIFGFGQFQVAIYFNLVF